MEADPAKLDTIIEYMISILIQGNISIIATQIVISAKNPIHRIAAQVIVFTAGAFIFMLFDFYFQGQTYLIVYVGAIAIQFQFVIMMVNLQPSPGTAADQWSAANRWLPTYGLQQSRFPAASTQSSDKRLQEGSTIIAPLTYIPTARDKVQNGRRTFRTDTDTNTPSYFLYFVLQGLSGIVFAIIFSFQDILPEGITGWASTLYNISIQYGASDIYAYFFPIWAIEYKTITDIESQAILIYVAYPTALVQISIALWTVMIGIISICSPRLSFPSEVNLRFTSDRRSEFCRRQNTVQLRLTAFGLGESEIQQDAYNQFTFHDEQLLSSCWAGICYYQHGEVPFSYGIISQMVSFIIIFIGILAFIFCPGGNLIMMIICQELILFAISLLIQTYSITLDDLVGAHLALIIIPLAGAESAIALALLVAYAPVKGNLLAKNQFCSNVSKQKQIQDYE